MPIWKFSNIRIQYMHTHAYTGPIYTQVPSWCCGGDGRVGGRRRRAEGRTPRGAVRRTLHPSALPPAHARPLRSHRTASRARRPLQVLVLVLVLVRYSDHLLYSTLVCTLLSYVNEVCIHVHMYSFCWF